MGRGDYPSVEPDIEQGPLRTYRRALSPFLVFIDRLLGDIVGSKIQTKALVNASKFLFLLGVFLNN